jgi:hypothetical protein
LFHRKFTNIPEHATPASSRHTRATDLTEICHPACKKEICHPACNKHRPGTKRKTLSHRKFTKIPTRNIGQQSTYQRHRPNRNLPPRLQNRK